jgi:predicted dehydrogenase
VFQNRRWDSDFKTVKKIINEGWLGEIVEAEFHFDRYHPAIGAKQHKEKPGAGAGNLKDLGPHLIDQALYLFGMPDAIFADVRITRPGSEVDDYFDLLLYYNKIRVRLKSSFLVREPAPAYIVHGDKGSFLKSRGDVQEEQLMAGAKPATINWGIEPESGQGVLHTEKDGKLIKEKIETLPGNYLDYYDALYKAIVDDAPVPVSAEDGINVMRLIEAAIKSNEEKQCIAQRK